MPKLPSTTDLHKMLAAIVGANGEGATAYVDAVSSLGYDVNDDELMEVFSTPFGFQCGRLMYRMGGGEPVIAFYEAAIAKRRRELAPDAEPVPGREEVDAIEYANLLMADGMIGCLELAYFQINEGASGEDADAAALDFVRVNVASVQRQMQGIKGL